VAALLQMCCKKLPTLNSHSNCRYRRSVLATDLALWLPAGRGSAKGQGWCEGGAALARAPLVGGWTMAAVAVTVYMSGRTHRPCYPSTAAAKGAHPAAPTTHPPDSESRCRMQGVFWPGARRRTLGDLAPFPLAGISSPAGSRKSEAEGP